MMDALDLAVPPVVTVSKLMGPEGFNSGGSGGGGDGAIAVAMEKIEAPQSKVATVVTKPSITACSSLLSKKEPVLWNKMPDVENWRCIGQSSHFQKKVALKDDNSRGMKTSVSVISGQEANQLERKSSKVARTSNGSSKRSRMMRMEISVSESVVDVQGNYSEPAKYDVSEKTDTPKQKNNSNSKRGDKRNDKAPKSRVDSFCLKNGLLSFSSAVGGNNFLGVYSSKTDLYDVAELVDELCLNELLDGSYKCPIYAKDKGKKITNLDKILLRSFRKAWTIFQLQERVPPQNNGETDSSCKKRGDIGLVSSASSASRNDSDRGDSWCSSDKVVGENLKTPTVMVDLPLHQPKDVLKRLALPPPKDLDSLLLDAAKPYVSSRNSADLRLGKPVSYRSGVPPFPWSHSSSAHCKSGTDAVKLSTARNTCQGRWAKVENCLIPSGESTGFLVNLESLTFDQSLVPFVGPATCISIPSCSQVPPSSSLGASSHGQPDEHSPQLLAAAQTLCEIAISSRKQNPNGPIKWPKKASEKVLKNCKLKANEKSGYHLLVPKSTTGPENLAIANVMCPSKKLKLSVDVKSNGISHTNTARAGPISWSAPQSIRSSPSKMIRESAVEMKDNSAVNKSCMKRPPSRSMDKAFSSQQKLRKVAPVALSPSGSKLN